MSGRPRRNRTAPVRFGTFVNEQTADLAEEEEQLEEAPTRRRRRQASSDEEEEEAAPALQPRRKRARNAMPAETEDDQEEESNLKPAEDDSSSDSEGEEEQPVAAGKRPRGGSVKRTRTPVTSAALKPWVPPPPSEPRTRADMLSLLFACPALIDALLEPDGLRTISLVARDAASMAAALCACTADMAVLWHQLARRCNPGLAAEATADEALDVVRRAVKADPARREGINKTAAQREYRLTERELADLHYVSHPNPIFYYAAPVKTYNKLDVLAVALRKFGSASGLQAAIQAAAAKSAKAKETLGSRAEERREEMAAALQELGLEGLDSYKYRKNKAIKAFLNRGVGSTDAIAAVLKKEVDEARDKQKRKEALEKRLAKEGIALPQARHYGAARAFIDGTGKQSLAAVVSELTAARAERDARQKREASLKRKLKAEGLEAPDYRWQVSGYNAYLDSGKGDEAAVVEAVRAAQQAAQQREARLQQVRQALEAESLEVWQWRLPGMFSFTERGEGSTEALLEAARGLQREEDERRQRRAHVLELLAAEGMPEHIDVGAVQRWIRSAEGSEQAALEAAQQAWQAQQAVQQRRADVSRLLIADDIPLDLVNRLSTWSAYVQRGQGSAEAVLQAAREARDAGAMAEAVRKAYAV